MTEKGDPSAWLLGIAANLLANQRRRLVREELARARLDARVLLSPDDVEALVSQMDASAEATRVRAAMDSLAEPYREVLLLIGESSLSPATAAKAIGISQTAFRVRLSRARRALRLAMESEAATSPVLEPGGSAPATHVGSTSNRAQSATSASALAAWTAQPTPAGQTQIAAAENNCAANFGQAGASQPAPGQKVGPSEPGGPWSLDLVDTRGDLTLTLYSDATQTMACLDSPSFVQIITVSGTGAPAVADNSATLDYLRIREASGDMYTVAMGWSGSAVSGVGLQRVDGSDVAATVGDGHFVAWWPEAEGVSALSVTTASGTQSYPVDRSFAQSSPSRTTRQFASCRVSRASNRSVQTSRWPPSPRCRSRAPIGVLTTYSQRLAARRG